MATPPMTGWVWPVLRHKDGRPPKVSSGWGSPRNAGTPDSHSHRGVDIMYRRPEAVPRAVYKKDKGSANYEAPKGTLIIAPHDATVWSVKRTQRGVSIILDHGKPFATFHQHLDEAFVKKGQRVITGQAIGVMGHGQLSDIRHLHFELWVNGGGAAAVDPQPLMKSWGILERPTAGAPGRVGPGLVAALGVGVAILLS